LLLLQALRLLARNLLRGLLLLGTRKLAASRRQRTLRRLLLLELLPSGSFLRSLLLLLELLPLLAGNFLRSLLLVWPRELTARRGECSWPGLGVLLIILLIKLLLISRLFGRRALLLTLAIEPLFLVSLHIFGPLIALA